MSPTTLLITYRFGLLGISSLFFIDVLPGDIPVRFVFLIIGLGLMGYWFRYELMIEGIRYLPATTLSIYSVTTPVFTAIFNRLFIMDEPYHFCPDRRYGADCAVTVLCSLRKTEARRVW